MKKLLLISSCTIFTLAAFSQWNSDPAVNNLVANTPASDYEPLCISDGANGSIIIFRTSSNSTYDIYAQKITASGTIAWGSTTSPVAVCNAPGEQFYFNGIADGAGGVYVAWHDYRDDGRAEIYLQHINAAGTATWPANGIRVTNTANNEDTEPLLCKDGNGGVIIAWNMDNYSDDAQVYAQRYNNAGVAQWKANGVQVCTAAGFRGGCAIVSDEANGAMIFFADTRDDPNGTKYNYFDGSPWTNLNIYAQRLNGSGAAVWNASGVPVCTAPGNQSSYHYRYSSVISDGTGGAIIAFDDERNTVAESNTDIYGQKLNGNGSVQWGVNGVAITSGAGRQSLSCIAADGAAGLVATWADNGLVYSQRLSATGSAEWNPPGVVVSPSKSGSPVMVADGLGNYIYSFTNFSEVAFSTVLAQKVNANGELQWDGNAVPVFNKADAGTILYPSMVLSGSGSTIISWNDNRNEATTTSDIFASKLLPDGELADGSAVGFNTIADGNWNDPAIWSGGIVPSSTSEVIVTNNVTVTANATCYSLRIEPPNGILTVQPGINLTITH